MRDNKQAIKSVLNSFMDSIESENRDIYESVCGSDGIRNAVNSAKKANSSEFYIYLIYPFSKMVDGLLSTVSDNKDASFFLKHGEFVEKHFVRFIEKKEGPACSADKSRFIMRALINYYLNGDEINIDYSQEYTYHLPVSIFNTHDKIVNFALSLQKLYYGHHEEYIKEILKIENG